MLPDQDRPSTWVKYRSGLCDGCHATCCTMPVEVNAADLLRLGLISEEEAAGSLKKAAARLGRLGLVRNFRAATGLFLLEQKRGRDCVFLGEKDRLCTVYDRRPDVCRRFPEIGPRPGFCPAKPQKRG